MSPLRRRLVPPLLTFLAFTFLALHSQPAFATFVNFESHQIHPLALSADGSTLFAVNTPDNRVSAFTVTGDGALTLAFEVEVGLEPVTVRPQNLGRVWVVNHLSDTISIVDLATGNVVATVLTADEPADVLFTPDPTNSGQQWAWVSASQADIVQVFDAENPTVPLHSIPIRGSDPRAMAYDPVRRRVYVAVFESGNATTIVPRALRHDPSGPWGGNLPPFDPPLNPALGGIPLPDNGVIVRWTGTQWMDEQGGEWTDLVDWRVTDVDVVRIDLDVNPRITQTIGGVGTLLFDVAVFPGTGDVYVTNTEALNHVLFEPKLQGAFLRDRLTRLPSGAANPDIHDLNPHVDYAEPGGSPGERALSLSQPGAIAVRSDGAEVFITAIGSPLIGIAGQTGARTGEIPYREGGTGIVLDEVRDALYVANRFTNSIDVIRASSGAHLAEIPIGRSGFDPTPPEVRSGRLFLYGGRFSAHGDVSCASCHPSGNLDNLSWDLGDPSGAMKQAPPPGMNGGIDVNDFHPLKGPMATQTLRGLAETGFLHWRGDRSDFTSFNPAFRNLLGGPDTLSATDMLAFQDFIMTIVYPPNPEVMLDNTLKTSPPDSNAAAGSVIFQFTNELDCDACHTLPTGTNGIIFPLDQIPGFGGQPMKIPQLRNMIEKTGFERETGDNIRGFGYLHDGGFHSLREFVEEPVTQLNPQEQPHMIAFLLSFPTGTAAAVGHQVTVRNSNPAPPIPVELATLENQVRAGNIDLIVKGSRSGEHRGLLFNPVTGNYQPDRLKEGELTLAALIQGSGPGRELTFTGVLPLCGTRMGIDRDLDGWYDRDELDLGTDPADPDDFPGGVAVGESGGAPAGPTEIVSVSPNPFNPVTVIRMAMAKRAWAFVAVYGVDGRLVKHLVQGFVDPGVHELRWDGRNDHGMRAASGTYIVALRTGETLNTRKVTLAK